MSPQHSVVLRDLERLVKVAGATSATSLGPFVREHTRELAQALALPETTLARADEMQDHELAPLISTALRHRQTHDRDQRLTELRDTAERAARALGSSAVWQDVGAVLPLRILFGDLLVDPTRKYVRFLHADELDVAVFRRTLADTARVMRRFPDATAFVDGRGLHVRWRGGRGQLNYVPQVVLARESELVLAVQLARHANPVVAVHAAAPSASAPRLGQRVPLVTDIFSELGFA